MVRKKQEKTDTTSVKRPLLKNSVVRRAKQNKRMTIVKNTGKKCKTTFAKQNNSPQKINIQTMIVKRFKYKNCQTPNCQLTNCWLSNCRLPNCWLSNCQVILNCRLPNCQDAKLLGNKMLVTKLSGYQKSAHHIIKSAVKV